ncbi:MAG: DUF2798 domain-containing protein [Campylobacteraceae bacterium]|nr:DUF2798 domain-containing protein [Campylobacteraceae bacterium]
MNTKQIVFFNILFSLYISIVLTLFMTAIFVGFVPAFFEHYLSGLIIAIEVSLPLSFIITPILEKIFLGNGQPSKISIMSFNVVLGCFIAGAVTFFIVFLPAGIFPGFLTQWAKLWLVAFVIAFFIIHYSANAFQNFTKKVIG